MKLSIVLVILLLAAPLGAFGQSSDSSRASEIDRRMAAADEAMESRRLAEAIRLYVAALSLAEEDPSGKARAAEAEAALDRIGARLSIEPSSDWVDERGSQLTGSSLALGSGTGVEPAVYLFEGFGTGKAPVGDAPIAFEFVENSGSLVGLVATDAYGKANSSVSALGEPGARAVIRAYPKFSSAGREYAFRGVFRDFAYLPPARSALVIALLRSELGSGPDTQAEDAVIGALEGAGVELASAGGKASAGGFLAAYGGGAEALAAIGLDEKSPYAALALLEVDPARQMELDGKRYNIFTARASASFRMLRSDGSVVLSFSIAGGAGQGGTREAAIADASRKAREALDSALRARLGEVARAFEGKK